MLCGREIHRLYKKLLCYLFDVICQQSGCVSVQEKSIFPCTGSACSPKCSTVHSKSKFFYLTPSYHSHLPGVDRPEHGTDSISENSCQSLMHWRLGLDLRFPQRITPNLAFHTTMNHQPSANLFNGIMESDHIWQLKLNVPTRENMKPITLARTIIQHM